MTAVFSGTAIPTGRASVCVVTGGYPADATISTDASSARKWFGAVQSAGMYVRQVGRFKTPQAL